VDATGNTAVYREGIFMGYRGFDKNGPPAGIYGSRSQTFTISWLGLHLRTCH
jgi:hypothetical protein